MHLVKRCHSVGLMVLIFKHIQITAAVIVFDIYHCLVDINIDHCVSSLWKLSWKLYDLKGF